MVQGFRLKTYMVQGLGLRLSHSHQASKITFLFMPCFRNIPRWQNWALESAKAGSKQRTNVR